MTTQVRELQHRRSDPVPPALPLPPPPPGTPIDQINEWLKRNWRNIAAGVVCLTILRSCSGGCGPAGPARSTGPAPIVTEASWLKNPGLFDDSVTSRGIVWNRGAAGNVLVTSWVIENGKEVDRRSQRIFLNSGESGRFSIELPGIYSVRNPHEVRTSASVPLFNSVSP
jgi:hypothetical protein